LKLKNKRALKASWFPDIFFWKFTERFYSVGEGVRRQRLSLKAHVFLHSHMVALEFAGQVYSVDEWGLKNKGSLSKHHFSLTFNCGICSQIFFHFVGQIYSVDEWGLEDNGPFSKHHFSLIFNGGIYSQIFFHFAGEIYSVDE
jgi:hypothetical protein